MAYYYREVHYHHPHHSVLSYLLATLVSATGGAITLLLAVRFVLTAVNVDRLSNFASFIFSASYPFVAPFFMLFNYQPQIGVARFEFRILAAMAFWAVATWIITHLITTSDEYDEEDYN